jgi:tetratricopeptide (TPR) repeat protein
MAYHAFVAMPFGVKEGIDFDAIYKDFIKPALETAGFAVFRADEEMRAGDIRTDMFQELLLADLVVADLSIDNPNVWYELGVRHALRARGVIGIRCQRDYMPFDVYTDRAIKYRIKDGKPDPSFIDEDKKLLVTFATETMNSWYERKISPVYNLLPDLTEPDWKRLLVLKANEFAGRYKEWSMRIEIARKANRAGDILVLAEEGFNMGFRNETYRAAGKALLSLKQFELALEQFEKALSLAPNDLESRRQKGLLLGRLGQTAAAKEWLEQLVNDCLEDAESWALLGRIQKDTWIAGWRGDGKSAEQKRLDALAEEGVLREAIDAYLTGFQKDPSHYYSGINAVTLLHLLKHLNSQTHNVTELEEIEGGVRWAVLTASKRKPKEYWPRVTLADLEVLAGDKNAVQAAYKNAVAVADNDWFNLNSSREQLLLLRDLEFRPEEVNAAVQVVERELNRIAEPKKKWSPEQVFLFSGHMVDAPGRSEPRFPIEKEPDAAKAIQKKLDELNAGPQDLALCGGACGGDLLFAEACLERGLAVELRLAFDEPTFLTKSVSFAPGNWTDRFYRVKGNSKTRVLIMPTELGPLPKGIDAFARINLWQLYTALAWGPEKVLFICLWNRKGGDGPGGTQDMYETVQKYSGRVYVLDTNSLW